MELDGRMNYLFSQSIMDTVNPSLITCRVMRQVEGKLRELDDKMAVFDEAMLQQEQMQARQSITDGFNQSLVLPTNH